MRRAETSRRIALRQSPAGLVPSSQYLPGNGAAMTVASILARLDVSFGLSPETNAVSFDPNGMHVAFFADDFACV